MKLKRGEEAEYSTFPRTDKGPQELFNVFRTRLELVALDVMQQFLLIRSRCE